MIGPNAANTSIMGGGSAQLAAHYQVSVLDALHEAFDGRVEIVHEPGVDIVRSVPPLAAPLLRSSDGDDGWIMELFEGAELAGDVVDRSSRANTELWFFGPPPKLGRVFSARLTGAFTPEEDGRWVVSLAQAGRARLFVDGRVVIDGFDRPLAPGHSFLGTGSDEVRASLDVEAGRPLEIVVEFANPDGRLLSGVRVGARPAPPADLVERAVAAASTADAVVLVVGTSNEWESEGHDRESMDLPGAQDELIARVLDVHPDAIVVVNAGAPVTMPWADRARAIAQVWFGGQETGHAVVDVLTGAAEPGGRLPTTIPVRLEHNPSFGNFPPENGEIRYGEGLFMGYRWYEARGLPTRFAFGHGLSYSSFALGFPRLSSSTFEPGSTLVVEIDVTNTGARRGSEVVQCYVGHDEARLSRPRKELKAFAKVTLDAGDTATVRLELGDRAFAYWNAVDPVSAELAGRLNTWLTSSRPPSGVGDEPGWMIDAGTHRLHIGRSSDDIAHVVDVEVARDTHVDG